MLYELEAEWSTFSNKVPSSIEEAYSSIESIKVFSFCSEIVL